MARNLRSERDANLALLAQLMPTELTTLLAQHAPLSIETRSPYDDPRVPCHLFVVCVDPAFDHVTQPTMWVIAPNIFAARIEAHRAWGQACISITEHAGYGERDARESVGDCKDPLGPGTPYSAVELVVLP